jgi:hypothetical protein
MKGTWQIATHSTIRVESPLESRSRWRLLMLRGAVFVGIIWGLSEGIQYIGLLSPDEAWLVSAVVAVLVSYWIPSRPAEGYFARPTIGLTLVIGIYFLGFKLPRLFVNSVNYPLASVICVVVYAACSWLILRWRTSRQVRQKGGSS